MPPGTAAGYLALLARQTIPDSNRDELADALRGESWLTAAVRQSTSRFWWRRLEAARALAERTLSAGGTTSDERITFLLRTVLSRRPSADESKRMLKYLEQPGAERQQLYAEIVWALLNSSEFSLNR